MECRVAGVWYWQHDTNVYQISRYLQITVSMDKEWRRSIDVNVDTILETAVRTLLAVVCLGFVGAVIGVALSRITYPLPLEWMEGGMVLHVRRVLTEQPVYVAPNTTFTPFLYPPLYYYVSAAVASVLGLGFLPLRLVSLGATLGCLVVIGQLVRSETDAVLPALIAIGLFAASYPLVDTWFDLARVDMLFLLLALLALSLTRMGQRPKMGVVAGVIMTLAVLTKQSAPIIFVPLALYTVVYKRRFGMAFIATTLGLSSASMALLTLSTDGWLLYYLIKLPLKHQTMRTRLLTFWTQDLLSPFLLVVAFALGAVVLAYRDGDSETSHFYTLALIGFLGASWQARLHKGGWPNTLIPAYTMLAIGCGLGVDIGLARVTRFIHRIDVPALSPSLGRLLFLVLVLFQFISLAYVPMAHVPSADDRARAEQTIDTFESMEKPLFLPVYPYVAVKTGHGPTAHTVALIDILQAPPHAEQQTLRENLSHSLTSHCQQALLASPFLLQQAQGTNDYQPMQSLNVIPAPIAGAPNRPTHMFAPPQQTARNGSHSCDTAAIPRKEIVGWL